MRSTDRLSYWYAERFSNPTVRKFTCRPRRTYELDRAERCAERVLASAPALDALENTVTEQELARLIDSSPPQEPTELFLRVLPRALIAVLQPLTSPRRPVPPEGELRNDELSVLVALPCRADTDRLHFKS